MITTKKRFLLPIITAVSLLLMCFKISELDFYKTEIHQRFLVNEPQFSTTFSHENNQENQYESPILGKSFVGFKEALAFRESRGNYFIVNRFGYIGKYQFGKTALKYFGVKDQEAFFKSPEQQEQLFELSVQHNKWILRDEIQSFVGKEINGILITESGILAAAHLAGASNVKKFLRKKGKYAFTDAYGTTLQQYLKNFAGYDTTKIIANKNPKFLA